MGNTFFLDYQSKAASEFILDYLVQSNKFIGSNAGNKHLPLAPELKSFFKKNKKFGKRDRTFISELCYSYFRSSILFSNLTVEEHFFAGLFLFNKDYNENERKYLSKFISLQNLIFDFEFRLAELQRLFPHAIPNHFFSLTHSQLKDYLSEAVEPDDWQKLFFHPSDFFVRIKRDRNQEVLKEFRQNKIEHAPINQLDNSFVVKQGNSITDLETYRSGSFEVQDLSSQMLFDVYDPRPNEFWWDACAASGGKSLLLLEKENTIRLLGSDIRASILQNYAERLTKAGYSNFETAVIDLSQNSDLSFRVDGILLDVPCSGSGTWKRSPEAGYFTSKQKIDDYALLQRNIIDNAIQNLKTDGKLIYSTCSVFKRENEEQVNYILEKHGLVLKSMGILNNFSLRTDWIFYASFVKL